MRVSVDNKKTSSMGADFFAHVGKVLKRRHVIPHPHYTYIKTAENVQQEVL